VLYEARVPGDVPTLTPAWQLDAEPGAESLRLVLSKSEGAADCDAGAATWCTRFTLLREAP
jgi:hypothetical protein